MWYAPLFRRYQYFRTKDKLGTCFTYLFTFISKWNFTTTIKLAISTTVIWLSTRFSICFTFRPVNSKQLSKYQVKKIEPKLPVLKVLFGDLQRAFWEKNNAPLWQDKNLWTIKLTVTCPDKLNTCIFICFSKYLVYANCYRIIDIYSFLIV